MLLEGKFGPGTAKDLSPSNKNWKVKFGAIENKNRPESVYITLSSWITPKMSVVKAKQTSMSDTTQLAVSIMQEFDAEVKKISKKIASFFDSNYFDTSSLIFTYDFAYQQAKPTKAQFFEFELNLDTVNNIDYDGNPAPTIGTGEVNTIPFKEFERPVLKTLNKILALRTFSNNDAVEFKRTKKG